MEDRLQLVVPVIPDITDREVQVDLALRRGTHRVGGEGVLGEVREAHDDPRRSSDATASRTNAEVSSFSPRSRGSIPAAVRTSSASGPEPK